MAIGEIPVLAIVQYGREVCRLRGEMLDLFRYFIRQLDVEYLKILRAKEEDDRKAAKVEHEKKQREEEARLAKLNHNRRRR